MGTFQPPAPMDPALLPVPDAVPAPAAPAATAPEETPKPLTGWDCVVILGVLVAVVAVVMAMPNPEKLAELAECDHRTANATANLATTFLGITNVTTRNVLAGTIFAQLQQHGYDNKIRKNFTFYEQQDSPFQWTFMPPPQPAFMFTMWVDARCGGLLVIELVHGAKTHRMLGWNLAEIWPGSMMVQLLWTADEMVSKLN